MTKTETAPAVNQQVTTTPANSIEVATDADSILMKLIKSKQLPGNIRTIEEAFTIAKMGRELGFPIMSAFHNIISIQGKLTLTAKGQNGLMRKAGITMECILQWGSIP